MGEFTWQYNLHMILVEPLEWENLNDRFFELMDAIINWVINGRPMEELGVFSNCIVDKRKISNQFLLNSFNVRI